MRAAASRILLSVLERVTPPVLVSFELQVLMHVTARAFGLPGKQIWYLPPHRALQTYAEFTAACTRDMDGSRRETHDMKGTSVCRRSAGTWRLYQYAYMAGQRLRRLTGFEKEEDLQRLVFYLYRNIRISMSGSIPGEILVSGCFFSRYYTPRMCAVMSRADAGIIAGLYGGGRLLFSERITEGCAQCRTRFFRGNTDYSSVS